MPDPLQLVHLPVLLISQHMTASPPGGKDTVGELAVCHVW